MDQLGRRGRPRNQDREQIEARLIAKATALFFDKGYGDTTMAAVAAAARVSNTTLYARFPSKAALFQAVVAAELARWGSGEFNQPIDPEFDTRGLLMAYGDIVLRASASPQFVHLNRLIYSESGRFEELGCVATARMNMGVDWLTRELESRAERDGIPCARARDTARLYLSMLSGWLSHCVLAGRDPPASEREAWLKRCVDLIMAAGLQW